MTSVSARRKAVAMAMGLGTLLYASPAIAATANGTTPFGCRASVSRVTANNSTLLEPVVANQPTTPCATVSRGVTSVDLTQNDSGDVTGGPAGAFTDSAFSPSGATAPGASALAQVSALVIPTSDGGVQVAKSAEATASYACINGTLTPSATTTLNAITINGQTTSIAPGTEETYQLGGGSYVVVNEKIQTATALTERLLDVHDASGVDVVSGEAEVTVTSSDPCAGTNNEPPPNTNACPAGSTLNAAAMVCEIVLPGQVIVVGPPFKGPTGGKVVAVSVARKKYKSPCLNGSGPKYALLAFKAHGRVTGTPRSDRILAFGNGERVAGLAGPDCIDGRGVGQTIWDGSGADRIYGGPGKTRIGVGNGASRIEGRSGSDWITAGNGNDWIWGGTRASRIDAGIGHDHIFGGPKADRIWVAGAHSFVSCGSGKSNLAFLRFRAIKYAQQHGCQQIVKLR
jgi:RTX calcium-binding nonapeptide repeat (4 copies)